MILGIIIGAFILAAALWIVGRHEAEISLPLVLMISAGVSIITTFLGLLLGYVGLGISFFLTMGAIYKFCYLGWAKSALVALLYFVGRIGFAIVYMKVMGH